MSEPRAIDLDQAFGRLRDAAGLLQVWYGRRTPDPGSSRVHAGNDALELLNQVLQLVRDARDLLQEQWRLDCIDRAAAVDRLLAEQVIRERYPRDAVTEVIPMPAGVTGWALGGRGSLTDPVDPRWHVQ